MKVILIFPSMQNKLDIYSESSFFSRISTRLLNLGKGNITPPLSLLMLAAVTPADIEIKIVDERIESIDFDESVDLVGITVVTFCAQRAYEISREFRSRGVKVVLGGIHPSALPREAALHADTLVLGEGEGVWPQLLRDFQRGSLQPLYRGLPQMDLDSLPFPRREVLSHPEKYLTTKMVAATRGCPNTCTFCSAGIGLLKKYRKRSIKNVMAELEQVPGRITLFSDDNIGWDPQYALELFREITPLKLRWYGEISSNALDEPGLIEQAGKSGCFMFGVGFESISPEVIANIRKSKTNQPERYPAQIRRMHANGISVWPGFILGFDEDDLDSFKKLADFIHANQIEYPNLYVLTPYPGSVLYRKFDRSGRLLTKDWSLYEPADGICVYQPRQMTPMQLMEGFYQLQQQVYSFRSISNRLVRSRTRFTFGSAAALHLNLESNSRLPVLKDRISAFRNHPSHRIKFRE